MSDVLLLLCCCVVVLLCCCAVVLLCCSDVGRLVWSQQLLILECGVLHLSTSAVSTTGDKTPSVDSTSRYLHTSCSHSRYSIPCALSRAAHNAKEGPKHGK